MACLVVQGSLGVQGAQGLDPVTPPVKKVQLVDFFTHEVVE